MTLQEWRAENGFGGRGRPSKAEMAARAEYLAQGNVFDNPKNVPVQAKAKAKAKPVKAAPVRKATDIIEPASPLWDAGITYRDEYGKDVAPAEVCGNCVASLPWCRCRMFSWALNSKNVSGQVRRYNGKSEVFAPWG